MSERITLKEAPATLKLQKKRRNLKRNSRRERERTCFWTWPLGHVWRVFKTEPIEMDALSDDEGWFTKRPIHIVVSVCQCCEKQRRHGVDERGRLHQELTSRVWEFLMELPA